MTGSDRDKPALDSRSVAWEIEQLKEDYEVDHGSLFALVHLKDVETPAGWSPSHITLRIVLDQYPLQSPIVKVPSELTLREELPSAVKRLEDENWNLYAIADFWDYQITIPELIERIEDDMVRLSRSEDSIHDDRQQTASAQVSQQ